MRRHISARPKFRRGEELGYVISTEHARVRHESAVTLALIAHRELFGRVYRGILPNYFNSMPPNSGVFISSCVPTHLISNTSQQPGDIDILVVPYEGDELALHQTLVVEVKVIRAKFLNQGKSPNSLGFSQAKSLLKMGFPYVAVVHLIVSDESPRTHWREMKMARILDSNGRAELLPDDVYDCLPMDLIERCFGRLQASSPVPEIGLVSVYIDATNWDTAESNLWARGIWYPRCRQASTNAYVDPLLLERVAAAFDNYPQHFLDTPRFDPIDPRKSDDAHRI